MEILVTGASGFAGRALCRALGEAGHTVHALTRNPTRLALDGPLRAVIHEGGVADPRNVADAAQGCDVLVHTAGVGYVRCGERVARWLHVAGTENVLKAARHAGCRRVVHLSCADVTLHDGDRLHWDEARSLPTNPLGPHARSKLVAEEIALAASDHRLEVTALRPAWLWGAGDYDGIANLAHLSGEKGLPLPDGGRSLLAHTHIDNLISGVRAALDASAAPGRAYHITDGDFLDAREFFASLCTAVGLPTPRDGGNPKLALWRAQLRQRLGRPGLSPIETIRLSRGALFDLSRAARDLNYTPHDDRQRALDETAHWVKNQGGLSEVVQKARPLPDDGDVDAQIKLAGGE